MTSGHLEHPQETVNKNTNFVHTWENGLGKKWVFTCSEVMTTWYFLFSAVGTTLFNVASDCNIVMLFKIARWESWILLFS